MDELLDVSFQLPKSALIETPKQRVTNITVTVSYENPSAYGYPEVSYWSKEYCFTKESIDDVRRAVNESLRND